MMQQTILITGGTGKFGRQFVQHFLSKKWHVLFTTTSTQRGQELKSYFNNLKNIDFIALDLMRPDAGDTLIEWLIKKNYKVNHLVNNARSLNSLKTDEDGFSQRDCFLDEYLMDVVVPYEISIKLYQHQADILKTITNIGSQYGVVAANPNLYDNSAKTSPIQYGVAKAALNHLTKELAVRMANKNIRVNCIAYGGVEGRVDDSFKSRYAKFTPSERMLSENELAGPLSLLIDDASSAITGHTLVADGGWSVW